MSLMTVPTAGADLARYVADWHPGPVTEQDVLDPAPSAAFRAVLGLDGPAAGPGDELPPLWQWFHFLAWPPRDALGPDGHPAAGHFLPPLPDRTRMFAGGRCTVHEPLRLGDRATRTGSLVSVQAKQGRSGALLFVTQRCEYHQGGTLRVVEETDILYRSGPAPRREQTTPTRDAPERRAPWTLPLATDPPLLFRISALTANTHRIHYDHPYTTGTEGYPGLVVHGPLLALAMLELPRRNAPGRRIRSLTYRLHAPAFSGEPLLALGTPSADAADLTVASAREERHASARVEFA